MIKIELELYTVDNDHDDESLVKREIMRQIEYDIMEYKVIYAETNNPYSITSTKYNYGGAKSEQMYGV